MKALSLSQPWMWAVLYAGKWVENRSWAPPIHMIDQRIALHAATSWDRARKYDYKGALLSPIGYLIAHGFDAPARNALYLGGVIVGTAMIDRIVTEPRTLAADQQRWFFGPFGWLLSDVRILRQPVRAVGHEKLWEVPAELEAAVNADAWAPAKAAA
jgi:hypothetical protein